MNFTSRLLSWFKKNKRDLPWRDTSDPYKIWLSEIILQQTRIAQGISYYYRFTELFPDVNTLAHASEDQVLAAWQGLGYYSRARNLHHTAKIVAENYNGIFPKSYSQLLQLKGIGKYTAAAIASIAYNLPHAAVDGNIIRVLTRYFGIEEPFDENATRKKIDDIAHQLLDRQKPGDYNQALMDFGSLVCKPSSPHCNVCPFAQDCLARLGNKTDSIPVRGKKVKQKERIFHFFLLICSKDNESTFFIEKRENNDIWKNLYQLPMIETFEGKNVSKKGENILESILAEITKHQIAPLESYQHQLTHQRISAYFYKVNLSDEYCSIFENHYLKTTRIEFEQLGKPILIARFMSKYSDSLCI